ncbi:MAG: hypothetical protein AB1625_12855 [Acidobacteriota bacterium]
MNARRSARVLASAALAAVVVAVPVSGTTVDCAASADLVHLIACVRDHMREADDGFVKPSAQQLSDLAWVMGAMLAGQTSPALPESLRGIMSIGPFVDGGNGRTYALLMEVADGDGDGMVDRGFGTFLVDHAASRELSIAIPHPIYDLDTRVQGIEVFRAVGARSLLMAGTHRNASARASACQPSYQESDAAHNADLMFLAGTQALIAHYGGRQWHQIQFHGLGSSPCPETDVFVSHGEYRVPPAAADIVHTLRARVLADHPTWRITLDGGSCTHDGGSNVAGRLIGGVALDRVCSDDPASRVETFIHIEQKAGFRGSADWIPAILATWPAESPALRRVRRRVHSTRAMGTAMPDTGTAR